MFQMTHWILASHDFGFSGDIHCSQIHKCIVHNFQIKNYLKSFNVENKLLKIIWIKTNYSKLFLINNFIWVV